MNKKSVVIAVVLAILGIVAYTSVYNKDSGASVRATNKKIAAGFIYEALNKKDPAAMDRLVGEVYIQHNPMVGDGKEALNGLLQHITPNVEIVRSIAEGDLVVQHNKSTGWGDGKTYVSFDVFRMKDNKIVEHWDVMQEMAAKTVSGRTQVDGPVAIKDMDKTEANKKVVQGFLDDVVYGHNWNNIAQYISPETYAQHNPAVGDGLSGFGEFMASLAKNNVTMAFEKTYRLVAEGDFVFVHSKGEFGGKKVAFADLFRLENGKIVEHWDVIQEIPAQTASGHDMFEQVSQ